jgi:hypothetical protein
VTIRYGDVPDTLPSPKLRSARFQAAPGQLLLHVDRVARYLITEGREIVIDPARGACDEDVRTFLFGSPFAALLEQRGMLVLHASVIQVDDEYVPFLGVSAAGKSTIVAALVTRGYPCVSDDLCALSLTDDGEIYAACGYPQLHLWPDSLERLGIDANRLQRVRTCLEKRLWNCPGPAWPGRARVRRLFEVIPSAHNDTPELVVRDDIPDRMQALRKHTYQPGFLRGLGLTIPHFKQVAAVAGRLPITRVIRPERSYPLKTLTNLVESALRT